MTRNADTDRKRVEALGMRLAGASYAQIGERLKCTRTSAFRYVQAALRLHTYEAVAEVRRIEEMRLDRLLMTYWPMAVRGDQKAADYVLRLMERRADLLGLDEPRRMTISIEEQARMVSEANGLPFEDALEAVKAAEAIIRERV